MYQCVMIDIVRSVTDAGTILLRLYVPLSIIVVGCSALGRAILCLYPRDQVTRMKTYAVSDPRDG